MAKRARNRKRTIRPERLLLGGLGKTKPGYATPGGRESRGETEPSLPERHEHEGRTPQPGIPAGPRNTEYPSASGYTYTPTEMAQGRRERRAGKTGIPKPSFDNEVPISGVLERAVDLLTPGPTAREIATAAHALGVQAAEQPTQVKMPSSQSLKDLGALVAGLSSGRLPSLPKQAPPDVPAPRHQTDAQLRKAEGRAFQEWIDRGQTPAAVNAHNHEVENRVSRLNSGGGAAKAGWQPRGASRSELASNRTQVPPVDPRDPLGKKTLGIVSAAQLARAQRAGTLRVSKKGILSTAKGRAIVRNVIAAHKAFIASRGFGPVKTSGQLTPEEIATLLVEEGRKQHANLTVDEIAEGVGVAMAETGGESSEQRQLETLSPSAAHVGLFAEEEGGGFGSLKERLEPRSATAGAISRFLADDRSWNPAWVHWQEIQGENETGADRAPQYVPIAQQLIHGGHPDPQAAANLQRAKQQARAAGINPTPWQGDVAGGGKHFTWVRADAKGMLDWAESAVGTPEGTPRAERWGAKFGLNTVTQPWCANWVANGLLRRGFSAEELPPNPNFSGDEGTGFEHWAREGKYATDLGADISKAKPGDLLAFSEQHIGLYIGNGEMISGNFGDEVSRDPISAESAPLSMVIRPKYKGGKVKVADAQVTATGTTEFVAGSAETEGLSGTAPAVGEPGGVGPRQRQAAPAFAFGEVPISQLLKTLSLAPEAGLSRPISEEAEPTGTIGKLLARRRL